VAPIESSQGLRLEVHLNGLICCRACAISSAPTLEPKMRAIAGGGPRVGRIASIVRDAGRVSMVVGMDLLPIMGSDCALGLDWRSVGGLSF